MCENYSKVTREYLSGTWKYQKTWNPKVIVKAEGSRFTDSTGMTYLDFSSQLVCSNLGHSNKAVKKAIKDGENRLGAGGRLLIRPSGTEAVIRGMAEGEDEDLVGSGVGDIAGVLEQAVK